MQRKKGNSFNKYRIRRSNKQMNQTSQALSQFTNLEVQVLDQEQVSTQVMS